MNGSHRYENTIHIAVFVYARVTGPSPILSRLQFSTPSWVKISSQA